MSANKEHIPTKDEMYSFYFENPILNSIERAHGSAKIRYFYFDKNFTINNNKDEVINGCLLEGNVEVSYKGSTRNLKQLDFFFLPPDDAIEIKVPSKSKVRQRICLFSYTLKKKVDATFELQQYAPNKFVPRGEMGSNKKMATYRTVWTAIKNGYFMSGFTNIPNEALKQGVVTSVNLEKSTQDEYEIYPHVHPEYPEAYIFCVSDENYAVTQYLINAKGQSVCKDLSNGEGMFFPGKLGHINFARPIYRSIEHCMYMWIIPTFGVVNEVKPITLKV